MSISGGKGKVSGVIMATVLLQFVSSGMNILGVNRFAILIIMGMILIFALVINYVMDVLGTRMHLRRSVKPA